MGMRIAAAVRSESAAPAAADPADRPPLLTHRVPVVKAVNQLLH
jgi:hypothetical protein